MTVKEIIRKCNVAMLGGYNAGVLTRMEMRIGTPAFTTVLQTVLKKVSQLLGKFYLLWKDMKKKLSIETSYS